MLKLIYGRAGTGKTNYILNQLKAFPAQKKFLLVPDHYSMYCERLIIDEMGTSAQFNTEVLSFSRLCNLILGEAGPLRLDYIDNASKRMLLEKALYKCENKLSTLKSCVRQKGVSDILLECFSEFKRHGVSPKLLNNAKLDNPKLQRKIHDLFIIYQEYNNMLLSGYDDMDDNLSIAATRIHLCKSLRDSLFFVDAFKAFTMVEYEILRALMKTTQVTISLELDELESVDTVFASSATICQRLVQIANYDGIFWGEPIHFDFCHKFADNPELFHIEQKLFQNTIEPYDLPTENVTVCYPKNYYAETEEVCRLIRRLVLQEGYRYKDICVLARNINEYEGLIPALFERYGINYFYDVKRSMLSNPLLRHLCTVLEILAYGFSYERIMIIVKSGFSSNPPTLEDKHTISDTDIFENYVLAADISYRLWREDSDYKPVPGIPDEYMERVNNVRRMIVSPLIRLRDSFTGAKSVRQICATLMEYFEDTDILSYVRRDISDFSKRNRLDKIDEYTQAWNLWNTALLQMTEVFADERITFERFYDLVYAALADHNIGVVPPSTDECLISGVDRFRNHDAKAVILLGVNADVFPRIYKESGILSEADRAALFSAGIELSNSTSRMQRDELNLIYSVLTTPKHKLFIFTPRADKEGHPLSKSFINERLKQLFPNLTEIVPKTPLSSDIISCADDMTIDAQTAKLLYGDKLWLSVSRIEKYNACAFSYFLQYGLILKERAVAEFKGSDRGSMLHSVMCECFEQMKGADFSIMTKADVDGIVADTFNTLIDEHYSVIRDLSPHFRYYSRRMRKTASATVWSVISFYKNSKFKPYGFEIKFRPESADVHSSTNNAVRANTLPSPTFDIDGTECVISADIDRVDISGELISIIDYKSSKTHMEPELIDAGIRIQPLIYAGLMCDEIENAKPAATMYMSLDDPIINVTSDMTDLEAVRNKKLAMTGLITAEASALLDKEVKTQFVPASPISEETLCLLIDTAKSSVTQTASSILHGNINAEPYRSMKYDACQWCNYSRICRKQQ